MLFSPKGYAVRRIPAGRAMAYIRAHHYAKGSHNGPFPCYGLFDHEGRRLIGVIMFAVSCSENVRRSVFGAGREAEVIELHRLHILDVTPRNAESWFIGQALRMLVEDRPEVRAVVSFSDPTAGHVGIVYRATNFLYYGRTRARWFYRDQAGRLRHPRQNGRNISRQEAAELGWQRERREGKYRYVQFVGDRRMRRLALRSVILPIESYPIGERVQALALRTAWAFQRLLTHLPQLPAFRIFWQPAKERVKSDV